MKTNKTSILSLKVWAATLIAVLLAWSVQALTISSPLEASDWASLTATTPQTDPLSPTYGPPPAAHFTDGPVFYGSGDSATLYAGTTPGRRNIESILFVFSARPSDLSSLGSISFTLDVGGTLLSQSFMAADFLSTSDCNLPQTIPGIGDGAAVLGLVFPDAYHAAARVWMDLGSATDAQLGSITVTTPFDLRVDIFGVGRFAIPTAPSLPTGKLTKSQLPIPTPPEPTYLYRIANNTPNSGATGYYQVPDGGITALLLGFSLVMMGFMQRARAKQPARAH